MKNILKGTLIVIFAYLFIGAVLSGIWTYNLHSELKQARADIEAPFVETDDPIMDMIELLSRFEKAIILESEDKVRAEMPMNFIEQMLTWPVVSYKGEHL